MALTSFDSDLLRRLVKDRSGIVLGQDKLYLLESRLAPLAREQGLNSIEALVQKIRSSADSPLHKLVVEAMTTNETLFFRDGHPFETLVKVVLPDLMNKRESTKRLTVWCAACSTGQEPYSVAMAIRNTLPSLLSWQLRIVASDLSVEVLQQAKEGTYSQLEVSRGLPPDHLNRFFHKDGTSWRVKDEIKKMIEFRPQNLLESYGLIGTVDIVFIRNVLIYFDVPTKRDILGRIRRNMAPDGYLFLGGAETTMNIDDNYERLANDRGGCYRIKSGSNLGRLQGLPGQD